MCSSELSGMAATGHTWLLRTCNVALWTEELTFKLYLILTLISL